MRMTNDKEGGIIQKNNRGGAVYGRKQKNEQRKNKKRKVTYEIQIYQTAKGSL